MNTAQSAPADRSATVDYLKAIGIAGVVLIHSMRASFEPDVAATEIALKETITFAVPFFFVASGYLYYSASAIPLAAIGRRLRRILVPYVIASTVGQVFWILMGKTPRPGDVVVDFFLAGTLGIYYFLLVLSLFVPLTYLLSRMSRSLAITLFLLSLAGLWFHFHFRYSFFWAIREPLLWLHVFLFGWILRQERDRIRPFVLRNERFITTIALTVFVAASVLLFQRELGPTMHFLRWLSAYAVIVWIFTLTWGRQHASAAARFLSDSTYTVYLYHYFFILIFWVWARPAPRVFETGTIAATWLVGVAGALTLLVLVRAAAGRRSRWLVGG